MINKETKEILRIYDGAHILSWDPSYITAKDKSSKFKFYAEDNEIFISETEYKEKYSPSETESEIIQ
jgi:hypothetical protein